MVDESASTQENFFSSIYGTLHYGKIGYLIFQVVRQKINNYSWRGKRLESWVQHSDCFVEQHKAIGIIRENLKTVINGIVVYLFKRSESFI